jgi:hypothetical protein
MAKTKAESGAHQLTQNGAAPGVQESQLRKPTARGEWYGGSIWLAAAIDNACQLLAGLLPKIVEHRGLLYARKGADRRTAFRTRSLPLLGPGRRMTARDFVLSNTNSNTVSH